MERSRSARPNCHEPRRPKVGAVLTAGEKIDRERHEVVHLSAIVDVEDRGPWRRLPCAFSNQHGLEMFTNEIIEDVGAQHADARYHERFELVVLNEQQPLLLEAKPVVVMRGGRSGMDNTAGPTPGERTVDEEKAG